MGDNGEYYINQYGLCPSWALSLGYMGVAAGAVLSNWGSAVSRLVRCVCFGVLGLESVPLSVISSLEVSSRNSPNSLIRLVLGDLVVVCAS